MRRIVAIFGIMMVSSTVFAGAAFTETSRCSEVGVDFAGQYVIDVNSSMSDGYSHEIKMTKEGVTSDIGSVNTTDENNDSRASMEKFYGKFPVNVAGKKGTLTFDGDATINPTSSQYISLRKATLKVQGQKNQSLLCVVE